LHRRRYDPCRGQEKKSSGTEYPDKDSAVELGDVLGECARRVKFGRKVACFAMKSVLEQDYELSGHARIQILNRWELRYATQSYEVKVAAQSTCSACQSQLRNFNHMMESGIHLKFGQDYEEHMSAVGRDSDRVYRYYGPCPLTLGMIGRLLDGWALGLSVCSLFFIVEKIFSYRKIFAKTSLRDAILLSVD